jgi:hypothetical protein
MPVTLEWLDDGQQVLLYTYTGRWTWDEYHAIITETHRRLAGITHPVYAILDFTAASLIPSGSFVAHLSNGGRRLPDQLGFTVLAGSGLIFCVVERVLAALPGRQREFVIVATLDEARARMAAYLASAGTLR